MCCRYRAARYAAVCLAALTTAWLQCAPTNAAEPKQQTSAPPPVIAEVGPLPTQAYDFHSTCPAGYNCLSPGYTVVVPVSGADVFRRLSVERFVSFALRETFKLKSDDNKNFKLDHDNEESTGGTLIAQVISFQPELAEGRFELLGKSMTLALGVPNWVERHRILVSLALVDNVKVKMLVHDYEPTMRTTPNVKPVDDEKFEYISREREGALVNFQDKIKENFRVALSSYILIVTGDFWK